MTAEAQFPNEQSGEGEFKRQEDAFRIVPLGPDQNLGAPHGRERLS